MTAFAAMTAKWSTKAECWTENVRPAICRRRSKISCHFEQQFQPMTTPVLHVSHLRKQFGDFTAVDDVSFSIQPGEILGLLGPNGAGKTTTIHMLLGLITPTAGSIQVFGMDLATHREQILQQVNFSSTYISMPLALTVEENLWVVARLYGLSDIKRRVDEIVKKLEMDEFRHKITRKLSSGQVTRLTLAKAILTEPKILFLDEPTASLDPDIAHKIRGLLKEERRSAGLSILYTSHNMREMEEMSDRIIFLQRGKIVAEGTAREIVARFGQADLEEVFLKIARESREKG
jgi:ABC-2 type transport system ATP-binding protein